MQRRFWTLAFLIPFAAACSTTPIQPVAPPRLGVLLQPERVEGKYGSVEALKADPNSTFDDAYTLMHDLEAALRRANRDQTDALSLLDAEQPQEACTFWRRMTRKC